MLKRKAIEKFENWRTNHNTQALVVTGARQVGKSYLLEQFAIKNYKYVVRFDLVDQTDVLAAMNAAANSAELFMAFSAFAGSKMVPGETVIFIDEMQECKEALTKIKYLVQREGYDYIVSGSLLGIELENLRSAPVGYVHLVDMFPLDFEEFCWASGIGEEAWNEAIRAYAEKRPVFQPVHERLLSLFHHFLVVGGMPQAVAEFIKTQNVASVHDIQQDIIRLYRYDISKYASKNMRLSIKEIYDQMPSQLDSQSKRFNFSSIAPRGTYERYKDSFLWLVDAGVAIPVRNVTEPKKPLALSEDRSFFKLFMNDVGLLSSACGMSSVRRILADDVNINYGAIYENAVAQELLAHGMGTRFFRNRKMGELDFVVEMNSQIVPVEVKSGKSYKRHSALDNVIRSENYRIESAIVLCENNLEQRGKITYCPVYMAAFLTESPN